MLTAIMRRPEKLENARISLRRRLSDLAMIGQLERPADGQRRFTVVY
ncbi:MAG TPA: hypothetical protein VGX94_11530 [Terriglobia bacterium]|nr:hypothetical protein [Terriglobia bacterium]